MIMLAYEATRKTILEQQIIRSIDWRRSRFRMKTYILLKQIPSKQLQAFLINTQNMQALDQYPRQPQFISLYYSLRNRQDMNESGTHTTGKKIENYVFNYSDFLGKGNFSKCYKARNTLTNQEVAIKIVQLNSLKSKKLEELLFSEIEVLKQMHHPNVLRCFEVFTSNRNCYIITELCNEGDLESKFRHRQRMEEPTVRNIVTDIYKGLQYIAGKNIIHRDLKISNIFMHNGVAKIADFGFALHCTKNFKDLNIGSPLYMAPEGIIDNIYGPKTDVWSFGIMVYELYHGQTPFSYCKSEQELRQCMVRPLQRIQLQSDIPNDAKDLILFCLEVRQDKRPTVLDLATNSYLRQSQQYSLANNIRPCSPPKSYGSKIFTINSDENNRGKTKIKLKSNLTAQFESVSSSYQTNKNGNHSSINRTAQQFHPYNNFIQVPSPNIPFPTKNASPSRNIHGNPPTVPTQPFSPQRRSNSVNARITNNSLTMRSPLTIVNESINKQSIQLPKQKNKQYLIFNQINFKECVSLLHYCRLIFKYLHCFKNLTALKEQIDKQHYAILGKFLMLILPQIYEEVRARRIRYEGQNTDLREKKMNEVAEEYLKKYERQLNQDIIHNYLPPQIQAELSLASVINTAASLAQSIWIHERSTLEQFIMGELLLTIYSSTNLLQQCCYKQSYESLQKDKQIENVLNKGKDQFDFTSYLKYKDKVLGTQNIRPQ